MIRIIADLLTQIVGTDRTCATRAVLHEADLDSVRPLGADR
jgi:hypothetical protein